MVEELYPKVPADSHLPQEVVVRDDGSWRLSSIGLLEMISQRGRPMMRAADGTADGEWIAFPPQAIISNLFDIAHGPSTVSGVPSVDNDIQCRVDAFREFVANVRAEWDGVSLNIWQEPLLKLLKHLGFSWGEVRDAVLKAFPPESEVLNQDQKIVFNRAASYVWKKSPAEVRIFSEE